MAKHLLVYIFGNGTLALISFLALPLIASNLTIKDYGLMGLYLVTSKFLTPLINQNIQAFVSTNYFHYRRNHLNLLIQQMLLVPLINVFGISFVILLFILTPGHLFSGNYFLISIPLLAISNLVPEIYYSILQSENRSKALMILKNVHLAVNYFITISLLMLDLMGPESIIFGFLAGNFIASIYTFVKIGLNAEIKLTFKKKIVANSYKFGTAILTHSLAGIVLSMSDRFMLASLDSLESVGSYTLAYQISTAITLVGTAMTRFYAPMVYKSQTNYESINLTKKGKVLKLTLLLFTGIYILICFFVIPFAFDVSTYNIFSNFVIISIGLLLQGFYMLNSPFFFARNKKLVLSFFTMVSAIMNILLNSILIPYYSTQGAAISTLLSYSFILSLTYFYLRRNKLKEIPIF